jgi:hypothetical protein
MSRLLAIVAIAAVTAGHANAGPNIEFGQEYEEAYLLACESDRQNSHRTCVCSMEALEQKVGFTRFAEEMDRHREGFLERSVLATLAEDLVASCGMIGQVSE